MAIAQLTTDSNVVLFAASHVEHEGTNQACSICYAKSLLHLFLLASWLHTTHAVYSAPARLLYAISSAVKASCLPIFSLPHPLQLGGFLGWSYLSTSSIHSSHIPIQTSCFDGFFCFLRFLGVSQHWHTIPYWTRSFDYGTFFVVGSFNKGALPTSALPPHLCTKPVLAGHSYMLPHISFQIHYFQGKWSLGKFKN